MPPESTVPAQPLRPRPDLLSLPIIGLYLRACEDAAWYASLHKVGPKRDAHAEVLDSVEALLDALRSEAAGEALASQLLALRRDRAVEAGGAASALAHLRSVDAAAVSLLSLAAPVTERSLKKAYRRAAMRHHPDRGGSVGAMRSVNAALGTLHAALMEHRLVQTVGVDGGGGRPGLLHTAADVVGVRREAARLRWRILLDDWSLQEALSALDEVLRLCPTAVSGDDVSDQVFVYGDLAREAARLASRLQLGGHAGPARRALAQAFVCMARGDALEKAQGREIWNRAHFQAEVDRATRHLSGGKAPRVVLNHARQVAGAFRHGVIDARRRDKTLARLAKRATEDDAGWSAFLAHARDPGLHAGVSARLDPGAPQGGRVPAPGYYQSGVRFLTPEQVAEYRHAFSGTPDKALVRKYTHTRLDEILRHVVLEDRDADLARLAGECVALDGAQVRRGRAGAARDTAALLAWLDTLSVADRQARLDALQALHEVDPDAHPDSALSIQLALGPDGPQVLQDADFRLCISTNHSFYEMARWPLERLEEMRRVGRWIGS